MVLRRASVETPVGPMMMLASEQALCALVFTRPGKMSRLEERLARWYGGPTIEDGENGVTTTIRRWLDGYFGGVSADISGLPLDMRGAEFETRVWEALRTIPPAVTTSYGAIAATLGTPGAARAVGMANGANPIPIIVPCHRVIGSTGKLTGYGGGLDRKVWLLEHERRWSTEPSLFTSREAPGQ